MALRFASEGARVVVADIRDDWGNETVAMIRRDDGTASYRHTDVADSAEVDALVDYAVTWGGRLDIMVNNAGINLRNSLREIVMDEWQRVIDVNLKGVFFGTRAAAKAMIDSGGGGKEDEIEIC